MKKILVATIVLAMLVIAFTVTAFAAAPDGFINGNSTTISKVEYDSFVTTKESANNKNVFEVGGVAGINLICSNSDSWYLEVIDDELAGEIEVAYKIGDCYSIVTFNIAGGGNYYIGDGKGKEGTNHAKVGVFCEDTEPVVVNIGFIGYYYNGENVLSTSFYWQELNEGDMIDWDAVDAAYEAWVTNGGLAPKREEWQTSGYASFTFPDRDGIGYGDFTKGQLESYYLTYYVDPGYILLPDYDEDDGDNEGDDGDIDDPGTDDPIYNSATSDGLSLNMQDGNNTGVLNVTINNVLYAIGDKSNPVKAQQNWTGEFEVGDFLVTVYASGNSNMIVKVVVVALTPNTEVAINSVNVRTVFQQ